MILDSKEINWETCIATAAALCCHQTTTARFIR